MTVPQSNEVQRRLGIDLFYLYLDIKGMTAPAHDQAFDRGHIAVVSPPG